jgi:hypothetical protein
MERLRDHREKLKTAKQATPQQSTSQQFRLEKPATPTTPPAPDPKSLEAASNHVAAAEAPEVAIPAGTAEATEPADTATSQPVDMEISPDEEAELLRDTEMAPPDDVEMETVFQNTSPAPMTPPQQK